MRKTLQHLLFWLAFIQVSYAHAQPDSEIAAAIPNIRKIIAAKDLHFENLKLAEYRNVADYVSNWSSIKLVKADQPFIYSTKMYAEVFHRSSVFIHADKAVVIKKLNSWVTELQAGMPEFTAMPAVLTGTIPHQTLYGAGTDPLVLGFEVRYEAPAWWLYLRIGPARLEDLKEIAKAKGIAFQNDVEWFSGHIGPMQKFQKAEDGKYEQKADGTEEMTWANGDRFVGDCNRKRPSSGKYYFINGDLFDGGVDLHLPEHQQGTIGKYIWKNGTTYIGGFHSHQAIGKNHRLYKRNGFWFGDLENGQFNGLTLEMIRLKADTLEGVFKMGIKDGFYLVKSRTGKSYTRYRNDSILQAGLSLPKYVLFCESGDCSQGNGVGVTYDGTRYEGPFRDSLPNGMGTMIKAIGGTYTGMWALGVPSGFGKDIDKEGNWYEGEWANGKRNGTGTSWQNKGSWTLKYTGQWVNNKKEGQGEEVSEHYTATGEFRNGELYNGTTVRDGYMTDTVNGEVIIKSRRKVKKS